MPTPTVNEELFQTDDIIIGYGEVASGKDAHGLFWFLPGGETTREMSVAERAAVRMDSLIRANVKRYDRNLVW